MIENFLNCKNSLKDLSDAHFEKILPQLADELQVSGFPHTFYPNSILTRDWNNLINFDTESKVINATTTTGTKLIRHFMKNLYDVKNFKGQSIKENWKKDILTKALRFNRKYHKTPYVSEIIRSVSFVTGLTNVTIYRPTLAKKIVEALDAKIILDPCVGWGGRMLGTLSLQDTYYIGCEPDSNMYNNLLKMIDYLDLSDRVTLFNEPAELALPMIENMFPKVDICLTSPPFFNLEIYSDEETQSHHYNDYDIWIDKFITPIINTVTNISKYSAWSVKNFKTNKKYYLYDDITRIHRNFNWKETDKAFQMHNSKRPGAGPNTSKTLEITHIYEKKT